MAFIKIENVVFNTNYVAALKLNRQTRSGEKKVSLLLAIPKFLLGTKEAISQNLYHYEWLDFSGQAAIVLQDYFSSYNTVIDLTPNSHQSNANHQQQTTI